MREYNSEMKISAIEKDLRNSMVAELTEFLKSKYETVVMVGSNKIGVVAATYIDEDGFPQDITVVVQPTVKKWYDKEKTSEKGRDVKAYDLYGEAEAYEFDKANKKMGRPKEKEEE